MPTYNTNLQNGGIVRLEANQGTQDIANNRTTINAKIFVINNTSIPNRWANGGWSWSIRAPNGTIRNSGSGTNYTFGAWEAKHLGSASFWITHNADGTKSQEVTAHFSDIPVYGWFGGGVARGTLSLTRIPRGPRVRSGGTWRQTVAYVKTGGTWKIAIPYVKSGGIWKIGGG